MITTPEKALAHPDNKYKSMGRGKRARLLTAEFKAP